MCHSDEHLVTGDLVADPSRTPGAARQFPMIAGHEGAEVVEVTGPGVTGLRPGDHVVTSFIPSCGTCPSCASGQQNLCDLGATLTMVVSRTAPRGTTPPTGPTAHSCARSARSPSTP
jgi:Zn-dependent alcohol dehydrogenase